MPDRLEQIEQHLADTPSWEISPAWGYMSYLLRRVKAAEAALDATTVDEAKLNVEAWQRIVEEP